MNNEVTDHVVETSSISQWVAPLCRVFAGMAPEEQSKNAGAQDPLKPVESDFLE